MVSRTEEGKRAKEGEAVCRSDRSTRSGRIMHLVYKHGQRHDFLPRSKRAIP